MYTEDELLPISALQHVVFCDRQAALIHLERLWTENVLTIEGRQLHEQAHEAGSEGRGDLRIVRALPLRSLRVGLTGVADVVELRRSDSRLGAQGPGSVWQPFPVEYKRGKPKRHRADEVQLCAQAFCLEEMFNVPVPHGAIFYGRTRRRKNVTFDDDLRAFTLSAAAQFREIFSSRRTPAARFGPKCKRCSLLEDCRPRAGEKSARRYLSAIIAHAGELLS